MNKKDLAKKMTQRFGFSNREATVIVDHIFENITKELEKGRRVELRGLGTFGTKERKPSLGRVVKTGEAVPVPALRRVFFRPGRTLKEIESSDQAAQA